MLSLQTFCHWHEGSAMKYARTAMLSLTALLGVAGSAAHATEYGTVISSTPVNGAVPVGQRVCSDEQVAVGRRSSGAGALAGALIGGAVGNSIGAGMGRAAATGLGVVLGAGIGDQAEANSNPPVTSTVQRCRNVSSYEDRLVGYDVVYDYNGARYTARMAQDPGGPGSRIALDVNVAPAGAVARNGRVGTAVPPARAPRAYEPPETVYRDDDYAYAAPPRAYYYVPAPVYYVPYPAPYYGYGYGYVGPTIWIGGTFYGGHRRHH
jgi:uncharacterized protein YcfJ